MEKWIYNLKIFLIPCVENNYRPSILNGRFFSYLALFLILAKFATLFYLVYLPQTHFFSDIATSVLVKMANEERIHIGVNSLKINPKLNQAAFMKANDMIENNYFSHWSPQGKSPWHWISLAGYQYEYAGENLAVGFFDATEVHRALINSAAHRDNILSPVYQEIGIAVIEKDFYGKNSFLVVQMFAAPRQIVVASERSLIDPKDIPDEKEPVEEKFAEEAVEEELIKEELVEEELIEEELVEEKAILGDYDIGVYIQSAGTIEKASFNLLQFFLLEYDDIIQKITMLSLLFLGFILLINVFIRFDVQHPDLIFKGLLFLAIFLLFEYLDQETIARVFLGTPILGG